MVRTELVCKDMTCVHKLATFNILSQHIPWNYFKIYTERTWVLSNGSDEPSMNVLNETKFHYGIMKMVQQTNK